MSSIDPNHNPVLQAINLDAEPLGAVANPVVDIAGAIPEAPALVPGLGVAEGGIPAPVAGGPAGGPGEVNVFELALDRIADAGVAQPKKRSGLISDLIATAQYLKAGELGGAAKTLLKWGVKNATVFVSCLAGLTTIGFGVAALATGAGAVPGVAIMVAGAAMIVAPVMREIYADELVKGNFKEALARVLPKPLATVVAHSVHATLVVLGLTANLLGGVATCGVAAGALVVKGALEVGHVVGAVGAGVGMLKNINLAANIVGFATKGVFFGGKVAGKVANAIGEKLCARFQESSFERDRRLAEAAALPGNAL